MIRWACESEIKFVNLIYSSNWPPLPTSQHDDDTENITEERCSQFRIVGRWEFLRYLIRLGSCRKFSIAPHRLYVMWFFFFYIYMFLGIDSGLLTHIFCDVKKVSFKRFDWDQNFLVRWFFFVCVICRKVLILCLLVLNILATSSIRIHF